MSGGGFEAAVLSWLNRNNDLFRTPYAVEVLAVTATTVDVGDTEHGFDEAPAVNVRYVRPNGEVTHRMVSDDELSSLWAHVMGVAAREWAAPPGVCGAPSAEPVDGRILTCAYERDHDGWHGDEHGVANWPVTA